MRRVAILASALACALMASRAAASPEALPEALDGEWAVGAAEGPGAEAVLQTKSLRVRFSLEKGMIKVGVSGGCNGMGGSGVLRGDETSFAPIISTMMACRPPLMEADRFVSSVLAGPARLALRADSSGSVLVARTGARELQLVCGPEEDGSDADPA